MIKALISIIVPAFNAENTLARCVESVISQSYKNWELLIINDGSYDKTEMIALGYCCRDPRIKVFHQDNMGRSIARNKGIENASGDWIVFLDSDDILLDNSLSYLVRAGMASDIDGVWGGYRIGDKIYTYSNTEKHIQDAKSIVFAILDPKKNAAKINLKKMNHKALF